MKHKSITLVILMLTFLSIFSVNIHVVQNIDRRLDQINFFKAEVELEETVDGKFEGECEQSDTLSESLSENLSWFMFSTDIAFILLQPINLK